MHSQRSHTINSLKGHLQESEFESYNAAASGNAAKNAAFLSRGVMPQGMIMNALYDEIGEGYAVGRRTDPAIATQLNKYLRNAESILNIGAGTGSYEPEKSNLVALEPSTEMIRQRAEGSHPVKQGFAESLPFPNNSFSHAMTVLSLHHWTDRSAAYAEIKRVVTERVVFLTWDPCSAPYWLTEEYFPQVYEIDCSIFPSIEEIKSEFPNLKTKVSQIKFEFGL